MKYQNDRLHDSLAEKPRAPDAPVSWLGPEHHLRSTVTSGREDKERERAREREVEKVLQLAKHLMQHRKRPISSTSMTRSPPHEHPASLEITNDDNSNYNSNNNVIIMAQPYVRGMVKKTSAACQASDARAASINHNNMFCCMRIQQYVLMHAHTKDAQLGLCQ